ncbi:LppX_LprAFG lipoprotein [Isoptericola cucumis]|uniref:Lipoprotein n=1 Tax=Isoptericola cucumis TaxID=1776856 RepID=A0ABQ2BDT9_9MICO|nr:LppX_LprAFG lipoprotein [Isoptericola cucumis]GGI12079.1 hypothetical protein GCM10007368_39380 [Isoptericola cucumis]
MRVTKKFTVLVAAGALVGSLAACGSEGEAPATGADGGSTSSEMAAQPASLTDLAAQMKDAQVGASSAHFEMAYGGELAKASGLTESGTSGDIVMGDSASPEDVEMQMTMNAMGLDMDLRMVDGTLYIGMGAMTDGKFLTATLEELADDPNLAGTLDSMEGMDAAAQAEAMADAVTSFEHAGVEEVDGVETDVYTMTVDPSKVDGAAGLDKSMAEQVGEMTVTYKVTPDGLPLETDIVMDVSGQELTMDTTFSKWGEPVEITVPAEKDTVPYSEFAPAG